MIGLRSDASFSVWSRDLFVESSALVPSLPSGSTIRSWDWALFSTKSYRNVTPRRPRYGYLPPRIGCWALTRPERLVWTVATDPSLTIPFEYELRQLRDSVDRIIERHVAGGSPTVTLKLVEEREYP